MTKLRLIKPWGLRIVRQHLSEVSDMRLEPAAFTMCTGPVCEIQGVFNTRFSMADIRSAQNLGPHTAHRVAAPKLTTVLLRFSETNIR